MLQPIIIIGIIGLLNSCILLGTVTKDDYFLSKFYYTNETKERYKLNKYETKVCRSKLTKNRQLMEELKNRLHDDKMNQKFYNVRITYLYNVDSMNNCLLFFGEYE
jgi:hypothetical protein